MFLDADLQTQVKAALEPIDRDLELRVYTASDLVVPGRDAPGEQRATLALLEEVAALSERITVSEHPLASDEARALGLELAPTVVFREAGGERGNIRFAGLPGGYEFTTVIETLRMLGSGESGLGERERAKLEALAEPVRLRTFVTPTCPYCPRSVLAAVRLAMHSSHVVAEGIEATEFPELTRKHRIGGVPDTVVEGKQVERLLGAQPDRFVVDAVLAAAGVEVAPA